MIKITTGQYNLEGLERSFSVQLCFTPDAWELRKTMGIS